jgi:hypothetical protein
MYRLASYVPCCLQQHCLGVQRADFSFFAGDLDFAGYKLRFIPY